MEKDIEYINKDFTPNQNNIEGKMIFEDDSEFYQPKNKHIMEIVKGETEKKEKIDLGIGSMDDMMLQQFISSILPKLEPSIKKASGALSEYLGDNEKIIILRQLKKGSDPMVIILNNKKNFSITPENFTADKDSIEEVFNVTQFIGKIFSGEFSK